MNQSNEQLYMLDMPMHLASWHKWAHAVYNFASRYDHCLFNAEDIVKFRDAIENYAQGLRNVTYIGNVDMDEDGRIRNDVSYARPMFSIGNEFSIPFVKIRGGYGND